MKTKTFIIIGAIAVMLASLLLAACSGGGSTYKAYWISPTVNGDTVSIPSSLVSTKNDIHFKLNYNQTSMGFVAYQLNGTTQVRARLCVPCRGESFTLKGDKLVCDTCGTVFSAETGKGVSGVAVCQSYPKTAVPFTTTDDGQIVMKMADLQTAFNQTMKQ